MRCFRRDDKAWLRNEELLPDHMPEQYRLPDEEVLRMAPAIYQRLLNKEYAVRSLAAIRMNSKVDERADTD